jgi:tetratricopeptide (TPR) repeat protein
MKTKVVRPLAILLAVFTLCAPAWATCGGGGGGGGGGMAGGGGSSGNATEDVKVYYVPWRVRAPQDAPAREGLVLYWFPATNDEVKKSSMRASRVLSLYASQCVSMELADYRTPEGQKLIGASQPPLAVLAAADGTVVSKAENKDGMLRVGEVEKLLDGEMKRREGALDAQLKDGRDKAKAGDKDTAIKLFNSVLEQKCMFPSKAKDAKKELKKLGIGDIADMPPTPIFAPRLSAQIERTMRSGLIAELNARYVAAEQLYTRAHRLDPADPVPLRYLGELYRHHIGDWAKARETFDAILSMPSDPLSRAVALHGLGKMTIHEGEFKKGLALMEESVATYPLALAYRNLAVYWNSEGDAAQTERYIKKALAIEPKDPYNLVFAAVFMAASGHGDEALKIARKNVGLLPASYNLAAIYAQNGQKQRALTLLRRHFYQYERYRSVRAKEMMEARVDAVFAGLRTDPAFVALTNGADGMLPMPDGTMGTRASPNK